MSISNLSQIYLKPGAGAGHTEMELSVSAPSMMRDMEANLKEEWKEKLAVFNLRNKRPGEA